LVHRLHRLTEWEKVIVENLHTRDRRAQLGNAKDASGRRAGCGAYSMTMRGAKRKVRSSETFPTRAAIWRKTSGLVGPGDGDRSTGGRGLADLEVELHLAQKLGAASLGFGAGSLTHLR
jgi:hypothetical protein